MPDRQGVLGLLQSKKAGLHLEVNTPDVDEFDVELVAAGVEAVSAPRDRTWGERTFNVRDPGQQHRISIVDRVGS